MEVEINSGRKFHLRANELTEKFGERPDGLVEGDGTVTVAVIVAGVLLAGLVVLVWWRRRRAEEPN